MQSEKYMKWIEWCQSLDKPIIPPLTRSQVGIAETILNNENLCKQLAAPGSFEVVIKAIRSYLKDQ